MSWIDTKTKFTNRQNDIATYVSGQMNQDITALNKALASYIEKGGVTASSNNPDYDTINTISQRIAVYKNQIIQLNKEVAIAIRNQETNNDIDGLLHKNGELQKQIDAAIIKNKELSEDAGSAVVRDQALRAKNTAINSGQVYLLGHPLRPASIPYLWGLSVIFIGIAVIMLYYNVPTLNTEALLAIVVQQIYNPWLWVSLLGAASIVIVFLILGIMGII
jgi:hypothetical protein